MNKGPLGALLGLLVATGLIMVVKRLPRHRRPTLDDRLAPYLRDTPKPSSMLDEQRLWTPFPAAERLLRPLLADAAGAIDRLLGGTSSVRRRLVQAGRGQTLEQFRSEQVLWACAGALIAAALLALRVTTGVGPSAASLAALAILASAAGALGRDWWLSREVARRERLIAAEFPIIAELLALAVTAGEGPVGALERVSRLSSGELSRELELTLADARAGSGMVESLAGLAERTSLPSLARFVDGVSVALERGTPLAEVLRAQAIDAREASKRALLEAGGRREIAMLAPVVFLVLPVVVVFALYPGFVAFTVISH